MFPTWLFEVCGCLSAGRGFRRHGSIGGLRNVATDDLQELFQLSLLQQGAHRDRIPRNARETKDLGEVGWGVN